MLPDLLLHTDSKETRKMTRARKSCPSLQFAVAGTPCVNPLGLTGSRRQKKIVTGASQT